MGKVGRLAVAGGLSTALVIATLPASAGSPVKTKLVSKTSSGEPATDGNSLDPSTSSSGRFVAFTSLADNLPGDDASVNIYVRDRQAGKTKLVSKTSGGEPAVGLSLDPSISASGRFVAFESGAANLPGDDNFRDVYVHDRKTAKTKLVSKTSGGEPADGQSSFASISSSGRWVSFQSDADNLPGDLGTGTGLYVHDRKTGKTKVAGKTSGGDPVDVYTHAMSASGRFFAFVSGDNQLPGDDSLFPTWVHDRKTGKTKLVSKTSGGEPADGDSDFPAISATGRFVAFDTDADNLPGDAGVRDIYVRDRKTGKTRLVSKTSAGEPLNGDCDLPSISASGRMVAFESVADNLPGDDLVQDVVVHDRKTGKTKLVNRNSDGEPAFDDGSFNPSVSGSGRFVAFNSGAFNLGGAGDDSFEDVYIRGPFG